MGLDLFKIPIKFSYKKEDGFETVTGFIMSIFFIIGISFSILFFGQDLYKRLNPVISTEDKLDGDYANITLNNQNFKFGFRFEDEWGEPIEDFNRTINFYGTLLSGKRLSNGRFNFTYGRLGLKSCREIYPDSDQYWQEATCFENLNFTITGYWDSKNSI